MTLGTVAVGLPKWFAWTSNECCYVHLLTAGQSTFTDAAFIQKVVKPASDSLLIKQSLPKCCS